MDSKRLTEVVSHALQLTGQLDRDAAYQHFVDSARHLTGARYAALAVLDSHGRTMEFINQEWIRTQPTCSGGHRAGTAFSQTRLSKAG